MNTSTTTSTGGTSTLRVAAAALLLAAALAVPAPAAHAAETPVPPAPARWLTDKAGFLSPGAAAELDARLAAFERASGHQLIVYIDRTTGGVPIEDWAVRAFEQWRVGRRGLDDGAAMFVFADDRRVRIEVGYGLESQLPDARAARIIDGQIVPRLRAGDRDGAVRAGVASVMTALGGAGAPGQPLAGDPYGDGAAPQRQLPGWAVVGGGVGLLLLFLLALRHPGLAWFLLYTIGSGRGGGGGGGWGGGGGGGGFSGGGGRSGGGGASGSW